MDTFKWRLETFHFGKACYFIFCLNSFHRLRRFNIKASELRQQRIDILIKQTDQSSLASLRSQTSMM